MDKKSTLLLCAALLCHNLLLISAASNFVDQKNWFLLYPPADPHTGGSPPAVTYTPPPTGHSTPTPTPSHGGSSPPSHSHGTPPSHGTPSHSHGTPPSHGTPSHSHGTPPANCGNPPTGGHHRSPTPSPPKGSGGGGYHHSPPTITPTTPTTPTPVVITPPYTPTPTTPISVPSPPSSFDPNSPPFTCNYWKNHPTLIWGLFGVWGTTIGHAFGPTLPGSVSSMNLIDALSNTRKDGLGDLYKEGTAALLNSMVDKKFPYTTSQVRDSFTASLGSDHAAAAQAQIFKKANEGTN